jgi:hypothetical protein
MKPGGGIGSVSRFSSVRFTTKRYRHAIALGREMPRYDRKYCFDRKPLANNRHFRGEKEGSLE